MTSADSIVVALMGLTASITAASLSIFAGYSFDRGLADRSKRSADLRQFYRIYIAHTRQQAGRIGKAFWIHVISAGCFIIIGVSYTLLRFILPLLT